MSRDGAPDDLLLYRAENYVWCYVHGAIHSEETPDDGSDCDPSEWRDVYYRAKQYDNG